MEELVPDTTIAGLLGVEGQPKNAFNTEFDIIEEKSPEQPKLVQPAQNGLPDESIVEFQHETLLSLQELSIAEFHHEPKESGQGEITPELQQEAEDTQSQVGLLKEASNEVQNKANSNPSRKELITKVFTAIDLIRCLKFLENICRKYTNYFRVKK